MIDKLRTSVVEALADIHDGATIMIGGFGGAGQPAELIDGRMYAFESPIHADFALIKAEQGDRWGNLTYRKTARNFGPIMAMAAKVSIASVHEVAELGAIDPEHVITPGLFVQRIVQVPRTATGPAGFKAS